MSQENLERFMTRVADSEDLQAKIGEEMTGDALVALGAAHGCEFSTEDLQAAAELSDEELERVAGGIGLPEGDLEGSKADGTVRRPGKGLAMQGGRFKLVSL